MFTFTFYLNIKALKKKIKSNKLEIAVKLLEAVSSESPKERLSELFGCSVDSLSPVVSEKVPAIINNFLVELRKVGFDVTIESRQPNTYPFNFNLVFSELVGKNKQTQVADSLECTRQQINAIVKGRATCPPKLLQRLADEVGVDLSIQLTQK